MQQGECYYLRLILLRSPVRSFADAMQYTDRETGQVRQATTFQESAIGRGYVHDVRHTKAIFEELIIDGRPSMLRGYFVLMMINGSPMLDIYHLLKARMYEDNWMEIANEDERERRLLEDLEKRLKREGKTLQMYGLPTPVQLTTELQEAEWRWQNNATVAEQAELLLQLNRDEPNNAEQAVAYNAITRAMELWKRTAIHTNHKFIAVTGPGGTGKSSLFMKLFAYCRSKKDLIAICSATTLAALLFEDATTAHNLFKFPVVEDDDHDDTCRPECNLDKDRMDFLDAVEFIFWDEVFSNNREILESLLRQMPEKKFFIIVGGDLLQILPVVKNGSKADVLNATLTSSEYWKLFTIYPLTQNMRLLGLLQQQDLLSDEQRLHLTEQTQFNQLLDSISKNITDPIICPSVEDVDPDTKKIGFPKMNYFLDDDIDEAINWMYPNATFSSEIARNTVILCATNDRVDFWNTKIQNMNPLPMRSFLSTDTFAEVDDEHGHLGKILSAEFLSHFTHSGVPGHKLDLKVGDVCLITRALHSIDVATNTRVRIDAFNPNSITVTTINTTTPLTFRLPRITFKFRMEYGQSFQLTRKQFPLRLAYAMTYNKSQSQTLFKLLVDATTEPFAHGHLYVAASRVRDSRNIRLMVTPEQLIEREGTTPMPFVTNIVYRDIIDAMH